MQDSQLTPAPAVEVIGVSRRFDSFLALDDVSLSIASSEFLSLLGPSGCGKTTLLRIIAGLDLPDAGEIRILGQEVTRLPAHKRPVNTVFQSYALFPHLNVRENVSFGLRMKRVTETEISRRVDAVMGTVQITSLASRRPAQLSGGQRQRVALARALVNEPSVLLLDEPLGALDLKLRRELQVELLALQRRVGITFIFVTHDQEEALAMSDRIAVMNAGRIEQLGGARELYERPRNRFVARFLGSCNLLPGSIVEARGSQWMVRTQLGDLEVAAPPKLLAAGSACTLAVRPEKIIVHKPGTGPQAGLREATVTSVVYNGSDSDLRLQTGDLELHVSCMNSDALTGNWQPGQTVQIAPLKRENLILLED